MTNPFQKAERKRAKLKIAITGPSGSGKTYSSLLLAAGLGSKIALIDTENESASLYSGIVSFDTLNITPPYTIQKYVDAIKSAAVAKYDVLIIDSLSHAWAGDGGLLAKKEALDARGGNSYTNWGSITKEHEAFRALMLVSDIHLIATMRSKQDYIVEQNDRGKSAPRKVGLAPIQRDGMEYEFTTVFDVAMDHNASVSKDRTGLFDGQIFKISKETGQIFVNWLSKASFTVSNTTPLMNGPPTIYPPDEPVEQTIKQVKATIQANLQPQAPSPKVGPVIAQGHFKPTEPQLKRLYAKQTAAGWTKDDVNEYLALKWTTKANLLTRDQYEEFCNFLDTKPNPNQAFADLQLAQAKPVSNQQGPQQELMPDIAFTQEEDIPF